MAEFEYRLSADAPVEKILADDYDLDINNRKLTFTDGDHDKMSSFEIEKGAYVKRLKK